MSEIQDKADEILNDFADETQQWGRRNPEEWRDRIIALVEQDVARRLLSDETANKVYAVEDYVFQSDIMAIIAAALVAVDIIPEGESDD